MNSKTLEFSKDLLIIHGLNESLIKSGKVRLHSLLYMFYWLNRLENNPEEHAKVMDDLFEYVDGSSLRLYHLLGSKDYKAIIGLANKYVKEDIQAIQTVDLVIERKIVDVDNANKEHKEVLLFERPSFPDSISLPGGLVELSDESNPLSIDAKTFAALRVAGEKVLHIKESERVYQIINNHNGEVAYSVGDSLNSKKVIIHPKDIYGYYIKENLHSVIRPSDPRHLVDTVGFKCKIVNADKNDKEFFWEKKSDLLNNTLKHSSEKFAFNHHKEIIFHMLARTSLEKELAFCEVNFVKKIIANPLESYCSFIKRFAENNFRTDTSFPELFPTVNHMLKELFSEDVNALCQENDLLIGFRDKAVNALRHVSLKNRTFCPYLPTVRAIFETVAFFDVVARHKKDFYKDVSTTEIIEHNPKEKENAAYHMYKYRYRMDELLSKVPSEIIIPTFTTLSATDLMKVRGVPVRFVGLSKDFTYVDEFEQSPEEFLMHDVNHSYRMAEMDEKFMEANGLSREEFLTEQNDFIESYLKNTQISVTDTEKSKELKKIKKIILFEIVHEDAKPFLPESLLSSIIKKEGGETKFEMPVIDEKTHYLDIVDVVDTEINTLSYVRNKLQCGFYDRVDKQNLQIVNPKYRKSSFIAEAAFEMVCELSTLLKKDVTVDYEYLLRRTCSAGPDNIYDALQDDEDLTKYYDGVACLNPKRYKSNQNKSM